MLIAEISLQGKFLVIFRCARFRIVYLSASLVSLFYFYIRLLHFINVVSFGSMLQLYVQLPMSLLYTIVISVFISVWIHVIMLSHCSSFNQSNQSNEFSQRQVHSRRLNRWLFPRSRVAITVILWLAHSCD